MTEFALLNQIQLLILWYEKSVLKVSKDGKYGLIDLTGKKIIEAEYEEIVPVVGIENSFKIKKDGKYLFYI